MAMLNKDVKYRVTLTAHGDTLRGLLDAIHVSDVYASGDASLDGDRIVYECDGAIAAIRNATPISTSDDDGPPGI